MNDLKAAEGGCLCGAIRYRVTGEPRKTSLCHCRSCRLAAGGPTVAWVILPTSGLTWLSGTRTMYRSSERAMRGFCGACGTALTYERPADPSLIDITTASLDRPDEFAPRVEIWTAERIAWEPVNPEIRQFPESSKGALGI
jgi:hypothetical protein